MGRPRLTYNHSDISSVRTCQFLGLGALLGVARARNRWTSRRGAWLAHSRDPQTRPLTLLHSLILSKDV